MTGIIAGWIWPLLVAVGGVLAAYITGRAKGRSDAAAKAEKAYRETRERMDDAEIAPDPDAARRWMRERKP